MASPFVFVNVTHPAHMRGTRIRKQVKSHTSRHNIRKTLQKKEKASAHSQQSASALPRHQSHPGDFQPALCFFSTTTPSVSSSESDDAIDQDDVKSSSLIRQPQDKHIEFLDCYQVFGIGHVSHLWSYCNTRFTTWCQCDADMEQSSMSLVLQERGGRRWSMGELLRISSSLSS